MNFPTFPRRFKALYSHHVLFVERIAQCQLLLLSHIRNSVMKNFIEVKILRAKKIDAGALTRKNSRNKMMTVKPGVTAWERVEPSRKPVRKARYT